MADRNNLQFLQAGIKYVHPQVGTFSQPFRVYWQAMVSAIKELLDAVGNGPGYRAGQGGTVTQAAGSTKEVLVTLHAPSGKITTNSATIPAASPVQGFGFVNNYIGEADTVVAHISGGAGSAYYYQLDVVNSSPGQCSIVITNRSGMDLSEALEINFNIIKGSWS